MLAADAASNNKAAIITDSGISISYSELDRARITLEAILPSRSLVFCLSQNSAGSVLGYLAFISNKIVPLMLDASADKDSLHALIASYQPGYIWLPSSKTADFPASEPVITIHDYSLISLRQENIFPLHPDLAVLLSTSGSTGSSKFARISYQNLLSNAGSIAEYLRIDSSERPVTTLPMHYAYGLSVINSHILKGATILLTSRSIVSKAFWDFVKAEAASSIAGVPYTFEILKKIGFMKMHLPSLRTLTQAGGKLRNDLNKEFAQYAEESGRNFFVMYGQTEATARMTFLAPEYASSKAGSIGKAIPGGNLQLIDDHGNTISSSNTIGELVFTGDNVFMGYALSGTDLIKPDEHAGFLRTGDLAERDDDGFYYIRGRRKRFIKLFGNRLSLDDTEEMLAGLVGECACTGEDDLMKIFITDSLRIRDVQDFIISKTGIHPSAISVRHCAEIPRNAAGKTIYPQLDLL
jgi:acyl-coenzyme A synthetase/AMP-(fatty) acid ligase